jgi:hypothetical protein
MFIRIHIIHLTNINIRDEKGIQKTGPLNNYMVPFFEKLLILIFLL